VELVRGAARPVVVRRGAAPARLERGVPIGSPIQALLLNIYLTPLDRLLEAVPGSFYARYGDDLIFCHPDHGVARRQARVIDEQLRELGLVADNEKRDDVYLTGPGRPSADWPESAGRSWFEYLGCRVYFGGQLGLKKRKMRHLLTDLRARLRATRRMLPGLDVEGRAAAAVGVVNRALDPRDLLHNPYVPLLRGVVNDRRQLREIDYLIALKVAETVTGVRGPRAFRRLPYRELRRRYGLVSLVASRNRRPSRRRRAP
jgi:hypothetical protein